MNILLGNVDDICWCFLLLIPVESQANIVVHIIIVDSMLEYLLVGLPLQII